LLHTHQALRVRATHDALTSMLNRASILDVLEKEMSPSSRDAPLSVLMLDLDRFQQINHTQAIWRATLCGIRRSGMRSGVPQRRRSCTNAVSSPVT
jgi:predicted signal transduction protein with EAL and GGDEF domain